MKPEKREFLKDFWLPMAIGFASIIISFAQVMSSCNTSNNEQTLFALQIFNDKLVGNRSDRELTLRLIETLGDECLSAKLKDISNRATIEFNKDSIWSNSIPIRMNTITELASLYTKYPKEVIEALEWAMPNEKQIDYWPPVISISQFFYLLELHKWGINNTGHWEGTKEDSIRFASLKASTFYKDLHHPDSANVKNFLDIGLRNFIEKK